MKSILRGLVYISLSVLIVGCATTAEKERLEVEIHKNSAQQDEIRQKLTELKARGEEQSEEAQTLLNRQQTLDTEQKVLVKKFKRVESRVASNSGKILEIEAGENGRNDAVEKLNQRVEKINKETQERLEDVRNEEPNI